MNHEMHEVSRMAHLLKTGGALASGLAAFLQTHAQAGLQMGFQKHRSIRFADDPVFSACIL